MAIEGNEGLEEFAPLTGTVKRKPFLVVDIESKEEDTQIMGMTRPFMVGVYGQLDREGPARYEAFFDETQGGDWRERFWRPGGCVDRAMRFVLRQRFQGHHIYAHNAGRFDFLFFLPWLMNVGIELGYRFSIIPVASSIQVLDVWKGRQRESDGFVMRDQVWRFLDSYRLIPTSLDKAAKAFGMQGKLKHDLNLPETDPRWIDYNGQDCSELHEVLVRFHDYIEKILHGEVGVTAPATSMKIFRRNYLKHAVPRSTSTHSFVRQGYVGGRVEPFESEASELRYFDINSSYPKAMLDMMPAGQSDHCEGEPPSRYLERRIGFIEADVLVPYMHIPVLPVKAASGKLIFPYHKVRGVFEWDELQVALSEGATIHRWGHSVWYEPVPLFKDFIEALYAYRDKNNALYDPGLADVAKNMMNAHYGKYGMKTLRKQLFLYDDPKRPDHSVPLTGDPECSIYTAEEEVDASYIMPQIAARVTALARIRLWRAMKLASCPVCWPERCHCERNEYVAYTDTDSIITPTMLPTSSMLGDLKDEIPEYSGKLYGRFIGPKVYILRLEKGDGPSWEEDFYEKVKAKGLERRTRKNVEKLARGGVIHQNRLEKIGSLARAGFSRGPQMLRVPRRILQTEGKRVVLPNGRTAPFKAEMW